MKAKLFKSICGLSAICIICGCARDPNQKLFESAKLGDINMVSNYLKSGGDPNLRDQKGIPLLMYSIAPTGPQSHSVSKLLIEAGADVNATGGGSTAPLTWAVVCNQIDTVELLLKHGADAGYATNDALVNAFRSDEDLSLQMMRLLVNSNINLNAVRQGRKSMTLLDKADSRGQKRVAEFLRSKGAKRYEELEKAERSGN